MTARKRNLLEDVIHPNTVTLLEMAFRGYAVKEGLEITAGTGLAINVAAGTAMVNGVEVVSAGESDLALTAANATYPRKDNVYINSAGVISIEDGVAAIADPAGDDGGKTFTPIPPAIPTDKTMIGCVWVAAGAVSLIDDNITDMRLVSSAAYGEFDWGLAFKATVTGITNSPTHFQATGVSGYGDNFFADNYYAVVIWTHDGAAPRSEKLICVSSTDAGDIEIAGFTEPLAIGDVVIMMHKSLALLDEVKASVDEILATVGFMTFGSIDPAINNWDPAAALAVTITGTHFVDGITVNIGGACTSVVVVNSTTITCLTPAGLENESSYDVVLTKGAQVVTATAAFSISWAD